MLQQKFLKTTLFTTKVERIKVAKTKFDITKVYITRTLRTKEDKRNITRTIVVTKI